MGLYIPKMTDNPGVTIPQLAQNFTALENALITKTSNENGVSFRWEIGLQICFRDIPKETLVSASLEVTNFLFPQSFVAPPWVGFNISQAVWEPQTPDIKDNVLIGCSNTHWNLRARTSDFTIMQGIILFAVGLWK